MDPRPRKTDPIALAIEALDPRLHHAPDLRLRRRLTGRRLTRVAGRPPTRAPGRAAPHRRHPDRRVGATVRLITS